MLEPKFPEIISDKQAMVGLTISKVIHCVGDRHLTLEFTNGQYALFQVDRDEFEGIDELYFIGYPTISDLVEGCVPRHIYEQEEKRLEKEKKIQKEKDEERLYKRLKMKYEPYRPKKG
jgi:hypothetical protein